MAGFLTHIAARLAGSEGQLRPRTPSLFEPAPAVASVPGADGFTAEEHLPNRDLEQVDEVDAPVANMRSASERVLPTLYSRQTTLVVAPEAIGANRHADLEPDAARDNPVTGVDPRGPRRQAAARPQTRTLSDLTTEARDAAEPKAASAAIRPASIVARSLKAHRHIQQTAAVEPIDVPRAEARRLPKLSSDPSDATPPSSIVSEHHEGTSEPTLRPAREAIGILQAPAVARIVSAPLFPAPREAKSEPAIHVTIGRVEVRAVAPPASDSQRGERGPSPVMSLDEYLRTRAR